MLILNYKELKKISYVLTSHELTSFTAENIKRIFSFNDTMIVNQADSIEQLLNVCEQWGMIRHGHTQDFEVSVPCHIFLKTKKHSLINKLSLIECLLQSSLKLNSRSIFLLLLKGMVMQPMSVHYFSLRLDQLVSTYTPQNIQLIKETLLSILVESKIVTISNHTIIVDETLLSTLPSILEQYQSERNLVVSTTLNILQFDVFSKIFGYYKYINHLEIDYVALEKYYNKHLVREFKELKITPNNGRRHSEIQDIFRKSLLVEFEYRCAICNISDKEDLIASHIVPVRDTDNLMMSGDYHNGLLLCRNHDRLFDQGMITFSQDGNIIISTLIEPESYNKLLITPNIRLAKRYLLHERINFLRYHQDKIFRKED